MGKPLFLSVRMHQSNELGLSFVAAVVISVYQRNDLLLP